MRMMGIGAGGILGLAVAYSGVVLWLFQREFGPFRRGFERLQWTRIAYANSVDGTAPLYALAIWPRQGTELRLLVIMHGYADSSDEYFSEARYWAERGRFCLLPDMRGRANRLRYPIDLVAAHDPLGWHLPAWGRLVQWLGRPLAADRFESAGRPDSNGAELLDIEAAMKAARQKYGQRLAPGADILGYSGGGTNALLAVARMPYQFERAAAFFPIVDFALQEEHLTRHDSAAAERLRAWIGGGPDELPHHYAMRSTLVAIENMRHTRVWVFGDRSDRVCPAAALEEFARIAAPHENIQVRLSGPGDAARWHHDTPDERSLLHGVEAIVYAPPLVNFSPPARVETWIVAGYLLLPDLEIYLGDLQQGVLRCTVTRSERALELEFQPVSASPGLLARIRIAHRDHWVEYRDVPTEGRVVFSWPNQPSSPPEG
jgi:dienelactone hydrolase